MSEQGAAKAGLLPDQVDRAFGPGPLHRDNRAQNEQARHQATADDGGQATQAQSGEVGGEAGAGSAEGLGHNHLDWFEKTILKMKSLNPFARMIPYFYALKFWASVARKAISR